MKNEHRYFFKAYENTSTSVRVVVNYELCERNGKRSSYEYVDKVFVSYGGDSVVIDMWNFDLIGSDGVIRNKIGTRYILAEKMERDGFSVITFFGDNGKDRFSMTFSSRDKSFRITENSFDEKTATGTMHNRLKVELPKLDFLQGAE